MIYFRIIIKVTVKIHVKYMYSLYFVGGAVALWLVRWTPDRAVQVRALAGALHCVLGQDTLLS